MSGGVADSGEAGDRLELSLLADDLPHIVWSASADGTTHYLNRCGREFLGLAASQANNDVWLALVHPDDKALVADAWNSAALNQSAYELEYRLKRADGEYRWIVERGVPRRCAQGRLVQWVGTCTDIDDRKRARASLQESEQRYRRLFDNTLTGFALCEIVADAAGKPVDFVYLEVNQAFERLTGLTAGQVVGQRATAVIPGIQATGLIETYGQVALTGKAARFEASVPGLGRSYDMAVLATGQGCFVAIFNDITERKRAEEEQARLSRVVEQTTESIMITDSQGVLIYVNPAFERVSGYTRAEAIGQNPRILKSGQQDEAFYRRMWETIVRGEVWAGRIVNRRKDGALFEEDATIAPVRDASGRVVNYVAVKRDVTNETHLERQLLQAQKMEAVGRLAGGVAHDFNNLLGVIMGYAEIMRRRLPEQDPLKQKVDQILEAAERAAGLTRQLLAFSRRQVLQPTILDLNGIVSGMEQMLRRLIGEDVELTTLLKPGVGSVKADPGQLEQVIMNLAVNARDAMPGGGRLTIETQDADLDADYVVHRPVAQPGPYVMLAVSDTGAGMDAETQAHAFEPFFTTKEVGRGTGLGLSTVYGIVKQSGGYIWLYSEIGVGTTFKIYLPRVDGEPAPSREVRAVRSAGGNETVLLIEDEEALREVLGEALEHGGYTLLIARDGADAVRIAADYAGVIHLIITDVVMPGMTGHEAVEKIAPARPELKVLFMSGYTDQAIARLGVLAPDAAFLSKPFTPDDLLRKVREVLELG